MPASVGAKLAVVDRPVVCITGDGGLLFTLSELAAAVEQKLSITIIVWNNSGYGEIARYMDLAGVVRCGVDLESPDFVVLAEGFGCKCVLVQSLEQLAKTIKESFIRSEPTLIEIRTDDFFRNSAAK